MIFAQHCEDAALDTIPEKVVLINQRKSPIVDSEIEDFLANHKSDDIHALVVNIYIHDFFGGG